MRVLLALCEDTKGHNEYSVQLQLHLHSTAKSMNEKWVTSSSACTIVFWLSLTLSL